MILYYMIYDMILLVYIC